ncbi:hypothetical protein [Streptomyces himalayensis]|uniref:Uncharacterized protein n=1 Tax=Streptomyces himalayensis subsp. himalayensis TaxID=2756131 RepID=A0A7W0IB42_9ACTN|nr:hypothetical protein [Streptomyces himalayensis]MBA2949100.1 hypothetical protein [Streptomyces himalayensis subsp. himalayensis]
MEQRRGPNIQPVHAAATDPAYVPGITTPRLAADPEETVSSADTAAETEPREAVAEGNAAEGNASETPEVEEIAEARDAGGREASSGALEADDSGDSSGSGDSDVAGDPDSGDSGDADSGDGPVFEAADRRGSITADHSGVRLRLDDQECEFRWDEIGAVEIETSRFGRWFTVTVHTPDRRWYPADIEVKDKSRLQEWTDQLDAVLDAYFEDGAEDEAATETDAESAETDAESAETDAESAETDAQSADKRDKAENCDKAKTKVNAGDRDD